MSGTKYDYGAYNVIIFDDRGRKKGERVRANLTDSQRFGKRVVSCFGGSYVIVKTIENSLQPRYMWAVKR